MKLLLLLFILFFGLNSLKSNAQQTGVVNNENMTELFLEMGGAGGHFSLNFQREFGKSQQWLGRIGVGAFLGGDKALTVPFGIYYQKKLSKANNFLEYGASFIWSDTPIIPITADKNSQKRAQSYFSPGIAFKHIGKKDFFWKASASPLIGFQGALPWLGLAVGKKLSLPK